MGIEAVEEVLLKISLYDTHVKYKNKIVPFVGYLLPAQHEIGIIDGHTVARIKCGFSDVSHIGEMTRKGPDVLKNLNIPLTSDYIVTAEGRIRYSPMCNEQGGVTDDLVVYKVKDDYYFVVVNAANRDRDYTWMRGHQLGDVIFEDIPSQVAQPALQGPKAIDVLKKVAKEEDIPEEHYTCLFDHMADGMKCIISKTDCTGEDGVEIYLAPEDASKMWELLMEAGGDRGLIPCGSGARDTLRLETGMPLYGHEVDDTTSPKEAGLGIFVKMDKDDFTEE